MLPLRYEMDMTAVMQQIVENAMEGALDTAESGSLISVSEMRVTIALGDFDSVGEIVIPEEAKTPLKIKKLPGPITSGRGAFFHRGAF